MNPRDEMVKTEGVTPEIKEKMMLIGAFRCVYCLENSKY